MKEYKEVLSNLHFSKTNLENDYQKLYNDNPAFRYIANQLELPNEIIMKYSSKIEVSANELRNCQECKNIMECKNEIAGYIYYPEKNCNSIEFSYIPCKYKKELNKEQEYQKNIYYFDISSNIKNARMKDIDTKDKNRYELIKWIKNYINNDKKGNKSKGLYLNGNFGCGKTFLLSAMLNELAKNGRKVAIIYYPEFLRSLKESFKNNDEFQYKFNYIKKIDYLLLDDIGAESVTEWGRDEILGTLLQYRMENNLSTFFTSNLTIDELEVHLSTTNKDIDKVKSRRIIERIKQLTDNITMISVNKRK